MKTIKHNGLLTRTFCIQEREDIDKESRTVELAFSSEEPVERWFGTEILDHSASAVRLDRLNNGGALLVDHDSRDHIGVVESSTVGADRRGRAVVRFGKSERADEIFNDVVDGIRSLVSVGYRIHKVEEDRNEDTFRATDWEPHEISIVSVPADASVGVGRTDEDTEYKFDVLEKEQRSIEVIKVKDKEKKVDALSVEEIRAQAEALAESKILERMNEEDKIRETAKAHKQEEVGETAIRERKSFNDFRSMLLEDYVSRVKPIDVSVADPDLSEKERKRYSIRKVLNFLANPTNPAIRSDAAFELEVSGDIADRSKSSPQGVFMPSGAFQRVLTAGTPTDGAEIVATNLLASDFIDVLRNSMATMQLGARVLDGLVGDVAIPRKTSGSAGGWIATEGGNSGLSEPQFDQVTLTPRTVGAYGEYTRQLLMQSTPSIDGLLQDDLSQGIALAIDQAVLEGSGAAGQPTGLRNQTGVLTSTIAAAGSPTWTEIVEFETDVAASNALMGSLGWIIRAAVRGNLKTTEKAAGTARFVMGDSNELNGYRTEVSEQGAANALYFGNWADILIGMWGSLDLIVDPYTNSLSGTVRVVALQSADVGIRHPESFSINV